MTGMYSSHEFTLPIEAGAEETATQQIDVSSYVSKRNTSFSCYLRTAETERELSIGVVPQSDSS
ncbi:hypothetical protein E6P09_05170 [Haloferax mediterranei ATCC 33500]|nr:hypothetical protein [Haloferax mediterranei]EMA02571.1 hypothetical protein C439_08310 [Haloferax mediterranei ATCC 33500]MDX5988246.1 hypothetical protein [Haloferax mediterranei ATCC 33500]QCQ74688.1 hypothetical protein E6P09_05170 [Haloferax mediterranei ATCC 33500]